MSKEIIRFTDPLTDTDHVHIRLKEEEAEQISNMINLKMEEVRHLKENYGDENTKIVMKDFLSGVNRFNYQLYQSKIEKAENAWRDANDWRKR
jgi:hypothetical protein